MSIAVTTLFGSVRDRRAGSARRQRGSGTGLAFAAAAALLVVAIVPPIVFVALPSMFAQIEWRAGVVAMFGLLLLLPGLVGLAAMRIGLRRLAKAFRACPDGEHAFAVWRIFTALLLLFYGLGLARAASPEDSGSDCLTVAAAGLVIGWSLLLLAVLQPSPAPLRRYCAIAADATLLSAFLHFGSGPAAASYPLYFLLTVYSGWRFGVSPLAVATVLSLGGFAMVVATTEFWRDLPLLSAGLIGALAIVPAAVAILLRAAAASQQSAAAAAALRGRALSAVGGALRQALTAAKPAGDAGPDTAAIKALRGQLQDADDLLSVAVGTFSLLAEPFDLHALVSDALAGLRRSAAERGRRLTTRIDPALPFQLRGPQQQLGRLVHNLVALALTRSEGAAVRLSFDAPPLDERGLRLRLAVRADAALQSEEPAFLVLEQLAALIGGDIEISDIGPDGREVSVTVPVMLDETAPATFDLADRPVLIVSDDSQFAAEFAEPLNNWCTDVRWIGGCEAALGYLSRMEIPKRPVLIVDGRSDPLPALSFVHRAAAAPPSAPLMLLIAATEQAGRIAELTEGAVENVLTAPASLALLRNALHALPLDEPPSATIETAAAAAADPAQPPVVVAAGRVTPITAHPRFVADPADAVDAATVESLRALAGEDDFLDELVANFRDEMRPIMDSIARAAVAVDLPAFRAALDALRRCAGNVGGIRLCEAASALRGINDDELRQHGRDHVDRLDTELARVDAALTELLTTPQARRQ